MEEGVRKVGCRDAILRQGARVIDEAAIDLKNLVGEGGRKMRAAAVDLVMAILVVRMVMIVRIAMLMIHGREGGIRRGRIVRRVDVDQQVQFRHQSAEAENQGQNDADDAHVRGKGSTWRGAPPDSNRPRVGLP